MDMAQWFKDNHQWHSTPEIGDVVFFKFNTNSRWTNHVGVVIDVKGDLVITIEGNTSVSSLGSQDNGGIVAMRTRTKSNIVGFGRPKYEDAPKEKYYPRYVGNSTSIIDALKSVGETDVSSEHRAVIFERNGGKGDYMKTAEQNMFLLNRLKNGILIKE